MARSCAGGKKIINFKYCEFKFVFVNSRPEIESLKLMLLQAFFLRINPTLPWTEIFKKFDKKARNQIKKAEKFNFEIKIVGEEFIEPIYNLYRANMKRHGTPPKPISFFQDLFFCFKDKCKAIAVFDDGKLIGVNVMQVGDKFLRMTFNLSKIEYWPKCINDLLYFKTIEFGYEEGVQLIDLGLGSKNDFGHNHFKLSFGARETPVSILINASAYRFINKFFNRKYFVFKILLNKIWRHWQKIRRNN